MHEEETMTKLWAVVVVVLSLLFVAPLIESGTSESSQIFQSVGNAEGGGRGAWIPTGHHHRANPTQRGETAMTKLWAVLLVLASLLLAAPVFDQGTSAASTHIQ